MSGTVCPSPKFYGWDANGNPLSGGLLYTYAAGTTTPLATYSDAGLTIPNANPVVLNASGFATIFLSGTSYYFELKTALGVTVWTQDNVSAVPSFNVDVDVTATAGVAILAGQSVYSSDGSGGLTAGRWYLTDADFTYASSAAAVVGIAPSAIASGAAGTVRLVGRATGLTGLTPGLTYYASATAGALTSAAPPNSRLVGFADSTTTLILTAIPLAATVTADNGIVDGRLTLTSGTPVTTADVTAAASVFFTPYTGNRIALYDGSATWSIYTFSELTLALGTISSGLPYDVFAYNNAGTVALELLAWTNGTTRATALALQNGVYVKTGATTRRYLGTFYTTSTTTTEDSAAKRFLWNYYNRQPRTLVRQDSTVTWTYTIATLRQANNSTANQVAVVIGVAEVPVSLTLQVTGINNTAAYTAAQIGIGENSTTAVAANNVGGVMSTGGSSVGTFYSSFVAALSTFPAVGYSYYAWLEASGAVGTMTWYGNSQAGYTSKSGLVGWIHG